jgi:glycosyltransferase 2 family protein
VKTRQERRWPVTLLKLALTVACFVFIIRRIRGGDFWGTVGALDTSTVLALIALSFLLAVSLSLRWWSALRRLGEHVPFPAILGDLLVGMAFNSILPSTIGGDVARVYRSAMRVERPGAAFAAVALERVVGLLCLAVVPAAGLLIVPVTGQPVLLGIALGALVVFGALLAFLHVPIRLAGRALARLAPRLAASLTDTARDLRELPVRARLEVAGWSLLYQAFAMTSFFVVARRWHDPSAPSAILVGIPIALILSALPITIGGLGLRESLFVSILARFGMDPSRALTLAFTWGMQWLFLTLVGSLVLLVTHVRRPARSPDAPAAAGAVDATAGIGDSH